MLKHVILLLAFCAIASNALTLPQTELKENAKTHITEHKLAAVDVVADEDVHIQPRASCILKNACFQNKRYYFEPSVKRSRSDAALFCSTIGMDLVSIESCEENSFIMDFIKEMDCTHENFWTSGILSTGNVWVWDSTGNAFGFTNWKVGEPNNKSKDEFCVQYRYDYLQWNDEACANKGFYICESDEAC